MFRDDYSFSREAGGWLKLHQVPATWNDAQLLCHAEGNFFFLQAMDNQSLYNY